MWSPMKKGYERKVVSDEIILAYDARIVFSYEIRMVSNEIKVVFDELEVVSAQMK